METTDRLQWSGYNEVGECDSQGQIEVRSEQIAITETIQTNRDVWRMNLAMAMLKNAPFTSRIYTLMRSLPQALDALLRPKRAINRFFSKEIKLDDRFSLTYVESPGSTHVGFGLTIKSTKEPIFCWEWFNVDAPGQATKLQETGEIAFETKSIDQETQISRMEFLTDVSIRLIKMGQKNMEPVYRVKIAQGSVINWPVNASGEKTSP